MEYRESPRTERRKGEEEPRYQTGATSLHPPLANAPLTKVLAMTTLTPSAGVQERLTILGLASGCPNLLNFSFECASFVLHGTNPKYL